jgi:hypothetical protein
MSLATQRAGIVFLFFVGILITAFEFNAMYCFVTDVLKENRINKDLPYCGAIVKENATTCEKCKQQLD